MQNFNTISPYNFEYAEKIDEEMEEDDSRVRSFRVDFSHYRVYQDQGRLSQKAVVSRVNESVWK